MSTTTNDTEPSILNGIPSVAQDAAPTIGKRKRTSASAEPRKPPLDANDAPPATDDEKSRRRRAVVEKVSDDLLKVLQDMDTDFEVLRYPLSAIAPPTQCSPPSKRSKFGDAAPNTIGDRLKEYSYTSLSALITDISAVCRHIMNSYSTTLPDTRARLAPLVQFEKTAKVLVDTERRRMAQQLDFVSEIADEHRSSTDEKVALAVLTTTIPVFSSLQVSVPAPSSPIAINTPIPDSALPRDISTVKATPAPPQPTKIPTLVDSFPPMPSVLTLQPMQANRMQHGLLWGGKMGMGGVPTATALDLKTESAPHWLQYTNAPAPSSRLLPDPYRQGHNLPRDFVAAYSSFAPTRDAASSKQPYQTINSLWYSRRGRKVFDRMFADTPLISTPSTQTKTLVVGQPPVSAAQELLALPESELEESLSAYDPALLDADATLAEISTLLTTLQSAQYTRFAVPVQANQFTSAPSPQEIETYNTLLARLSALIDSLPPHLTATQDGHPDSELTLSRKLLLSKSVLPVRGTLPVEDKRVPQTPMAASALDAAAGVAPVAQMGGYRPPVPYGRGYPQGPPQMAPSPIVAPPPQMQGSPRRGAGMMVHGLAAVGVGGYRTPTRR